MPIFEYLCSACGTGFESLLPSSDAPAPACPSCGSTNVKRTLSRFSATVAPSAPSGGCACPSAAQGFCPGAGGCCGGACRHD